MSEGTQNLTLTSIFRMPRFAPAFFAAFLAGLLLLFLKELHPNIRSFLFPSLVIYAQGAALISTLHRLLAIQFYKGETKDNEKPIPTLWKVVIYGLHILWFSALVVYNACKQVI